MSQRIQLVVCDWAGTTVDFGCLAPAAAFLEAFARHKLMLTMQQVRAPMGLHKYDHVRTLLEMPAVSEQFQFVYGRPWVEADVMNIYHEVTPLQASACENHSVLIPGVVDVVATLRSRDVKIGSTTGYPRVVAEVVYELAKAQGYEPDFNVAADDTPAARPLPWMIFRIMEKLDIFPPLAVVKIGDTVPDIEEGRNAGCWSIGVTQTGSEMGLTPEEFAALPEDVKKHKTEIVGRKLLDAGAHYVIPSIIELPQMIDHIEAGMETGQKP
nr:phosphonoacetaldehyde hydrolase [Pirellula staleyi]